MSVAPAGRAVMANRRWFDRWAGRYEDDPVSRWLAVLQGEALAALEPVPGDRLLDVGCGSGAPVRSAARVLERAVGLDVSPAMIERARALAADLPNAEFVEGEGSRLPFPDAEFTAVLCTTSFHHHPDPEASVREMARVLRPGGRLVIGDMTTDRLAAWVVDAVLRRVEPSHTGAHRLRDVADMAYRAGFHQVEARLLYGGGYAIVRARKAEERA